MASSTGYVHEFEERGGEFRIRVKGGERSGLPEKKKKRKGEMEEERGGKGLAKFSTC